MQRQDKVYAIGSCFARGVENALFGYNVEVLSRTSEFDSLPSMNGELQIGYSNKYNTHSILNELRWALDPQAVFPQESIAEIEPDKFCDPHSNPSLEPADFRETLRRRNLMQAVTKRITECRVVIVTLGLAEVWRDRLAGTFLNTTPLPAAFRRFPGRYEFHVSSFAENLANLEEIFEILARYGHPNTEIVVTVSPVPLYSTFSDQDIVIANTYSKSMLRAVAQEWAGRHPAVHYFPSYEIVLNSDRSLAWERDLRHVRGEVVLHIMKLFLDHYLE